MRRARPRVRVLVCVTSAGEMNPIQRASMIFGRYESFDLRFGQDRPIKPSLLDAFRKVGTMAKSLADWRASDVRPARRRPMRWFSEQFFFRDPVRAAHSDSDHFFSPADGILLYQKVVTPDEPVVELKGRNYTLRDAIRRDDYVQSALVIGVFMTSYDVHVNRVPYSGLLSYRSLPPVESINMPMLDVETALLGGRGLIAQDAGYLFANQRMLNSVTVGSLGLTYMVLQIADYDVATILPFELRQAQPVLQSQRFSQIRFGSQVDLIIPISPHMRLETLVPDTYHVEAGIDPLVRIHRC